MKTQLVTQTTYYFVFTIQIRAALIYRSKS